MSVVPGPYIITDMVQAYERGYARGITTTLQAYKRGRRDGIAEVCKYLAVDIPVHLCDEPESDANAIPTLVGDQEPQGSDPHE